MDEFRQRAKKNWRFFRQWVRAPLSTASVVPSSKYLAERMVAEVPVNAQRVVEFGAGTGVFTRELLARAAPQSQLMVVELSNEMASALRSEFTDALIVEGDARLLDQHVAQNPKFGDQPVDAVVSGLGFLNMPEKTVLDIVSAAFAVLRPGAPLIQFTYGPRCSISENVRRTLGLNARRASFTLRNLPPASVYVLTKK